VVAVRRGRARRGNIQCADRSVGIKLGHETGIGNQVVDATVANDLGRLGGRLLQAGVVGEVSMEDVYIGAVAQLRGNLLLGRSLVTDKTNDQVVLIFRQLPKEFELKSRVQISTGKQTRWD
jgi:hypothetical protein